MSRYSLIWALCPLASAFLGAALADTIPAPSGMGALAVLATAVLFGLLIWERRK